MLGLTWQCCCLGQYNMSMRCWVSPDSAVVLDSTTCLWDVGSHLTVLLSWTVQHVCEMLGLTWQCCCLGQYNMSMRCWVSPDSAVVLDSTTCLWDVGSHLTVLLSWTVQHVYEMLGLTWQCCCLGQYNTSMRCWVSPDSAVVLDSTTRLWDVGSHLSVLLSWTVQHVCEMLGLSWQCCCLGQYNTSMRCWVSLVSAVVLDSTTRLWDVGSHLTVLLSWTVQHVYEMLGLTWQCCCLGQYNTSMRCWVSLVSAVVLDSTTGLWDVGSQLTVLLSWTVQHVYEMLGLTWQCCCLGQYNTSMRCWVLADSAVVLDSTTRLWDVGSHLSVLLSWTVQHVYEMLGLSWQCCCLGQYNMSMRCWVSPVSAVVLDSTTRLWDVGS